MGYRVFRLELFLTVHCEKKNCYIYILPKAWVKIVLKSLMEVTKEMTKKIKNNIIRHTKL